MFLLILIILLWFYYKPYVDFSGGKLLLWFNKRKYLLSKNVERDYKILFDTLENNEKL